ncbi:MAG TPA: amidase [Kofleriaceae bacterium]|nr:amidase [Kofleriaceae bacterium]
MIDRRQFLRIAATSSASAAALGCAGGRAQPPVVRRGPPVAPPPPDAVPDAWIEELTIADLQKMMGEGAQTARSITEAYLRRIDAIDRRGPELRSVIEVNPEAAALADALDAERKAGKLRGPLHGIPVLVKDNIDTADQMATTAGSLALVGARPAQDATVVARLRAAGAVLLGKTNLSEWANFRSTRSVSGWSARGGQCRNPYALDRSPCGSSSGSGAAVAANLCAVAVGTETDGSILCPSALCNLVGLKPGIGMVSRAGIIPIAHSQDTAGPMARTVTDAAILFAALVGADPRDATTKGAGPFDPAAALAGEVKGLRLGIVRGMFGYHPELDRRCEEAIAALKERGAVLVDPVAVSDKELQEPEFEVLLYEFKSDLDAYLAGLGPSSPVKSLAEVIDFNESHAAEEMPLFGQEIFLKAAAKGPLSDRAYRQALARCQRLSRAGGIDQVMRRHKLDALVAPTANPPWVVDPVLGDHFVGGSTTIAAVAGYPALSVPVGFARGVPMGMSLFARPSSEGVLFRLARALEQTAPQRRRPAFRPTADLAAPDCGSGCSNKM